VAACACSVRCPAVVIVTPAFRGGSVGGRDVEAGIPTSSIGAGDLDLDLSAAVPEARRSHDGLLFIDGLPIPSMDEGEESKDVVLAADGKGDIIGLATSAYVAPRGDGRNEARLAMSSGDTPSGLNV
jgi:hypothetical protein